MINETPENLDKYAIETGWTPSFHETRTKRYVQRLRRKWMKVAFKSYDGTRESWDVYMIRYMKQLYLRGRDHVLYVNKFPYALEKSDHYILWSHKRYQTSDEVTLILKTYLPRIEFVWYENPRALMQIPHYHVFIRKKSETVIE